MMLCGAARPPVPSDRGWDCNGRDLVVVIPGGRRTAPAVIRADLLDVLFTDPAYASFRDSTYPLPERADHVHLVLRDDDLRPTGLPSAFPGSVIRCPANCGATVAASGSDRADDTSTVGRLRSEGWQVIDGKWTCPNDLPAPARDLPGAMGRPLNRYCLTCGDTRGGDYGHMTHECTYRPEGS